MSGKEETKREIINAAVELFEKNGFHNTSMSAIAGEAGVSKGTLYWHFSGKTELFIEIINVEKEDFIGDIRAIKQESDLDSAAEILKNIISLRLRKNTSRQNLLYFNSDAIDDEKIQEAIFSACEDITREIEIIIEEGRKKGQFSEISPDLSAISIFSLLNTFKIFLIYEEDKDIGEEEIEDFLVEFIFQGIKRRDQIEE
ncbi:MAG: TetR/AcrR family transcriptional regulator [Halanaerobiales bacterium]